MAQPQSRYAETSPVTGTVLELLRPGSFVRLRNHPADLPPFQLIQCRGGRCWVRQQTWGTLVQWEVAHQQLTSTTA
jgi:hypothetical protein